MENQIYELQFAIDTFYFLICGALVWWMAAGFAMLESGLVRAKNTTEILSKNVALFSISCVMYLICGYEIMYSSGGYFLSSIVTVADISDELVAETLKGAAAFAAGEEDAGLQYASAADFFFQVVFVATSCSIISGAIAERMKLVSFLIFCVVMTGFIYPMEGSWTWGGQDVLGMFSLDGFSDYAGSGIVHMAGAAAALAGVIMVGARKGKYGPNGEVKAIPGSNLPLAALGMFILWMGWFGFNGGSTLQLSGIAVANEIANVFLNTNAAAAAGLLASLVVAYILFGKFDLTMAINGALAGLVAITADPASPSPLAASVIGAVAGAIVVFSILALDKLKLDDPVGAISVHGVVGFFGVMVVPVTNGDATFAMQLAGAATIFVWVFAISMIVWGVLKATIGLRVSEEAEAQGIDVEECGMEAYPEFVNR